MTFNPLDCGKNPLQIDIDLKNKLLEQASLDLENAIDLPDLEYQQKLTDLKNAGQDKLDALNLTIPEIPKIESFQGGIDKLISDAKGFNPTILKDIDSFKKQWEGIVPIEKIEGFVINEYSPEEKN